MPLHVRMTPRDPDEAHRAATPLELFFDLAFVVAVGQAASALHHGLVGGDIRNTLIVFPLVFFAIWWAWMNFAWFASAYDNDDALYRLAVLIQVGGVLCLATGIPRAFAHHDFVVIALGYVVMRIGLVGLWLRAAASDRPRRTTALRYAAGVTAVQCGWIAWLAAPHALFISAFVLLSVAELAVPIWAEASARTQWHPRHIAERFGLFTIIVLGEAMLGATLGVSSALDAGTSFGTLAGVVIGGLLLVFSLWWFYFDMPGSEAVEHARRAFAVRLNGAFAWGYGHYVVFGSAAAAGAGLAVAVDQAVGHTQLTDAQAGFAITVPVCVYLLAVWIIHFRQKRPSLLRTYAIPVVVGLLLVASVLPQTVLISGILVAALVGVGSATGAGTPAHIAPDHVAG